MARTKKRAAPTAASERPSKKRKSAEAGMLRMKQIVDNEDAFSEDEKSEVKPLVKTTTTTNATTEESEEDDLDSLEDHALVTEGTLPIVPPGFRLAETKSKLASKRDLTEVSKYDEAKDAYTHFLKVQHDEAFKIVPLTVTQGPWKGRMVFMLEPQIGFFRFLELPPEIRAMVYECLFESDDGIKMDTAKRINQPRRPVPRREKPGTLTGRRKPSLQNEDKSLPTNINVLLINKQILREAAPVLYGNNHFSFYGFPDFKIFLEYIGDMRKYLRDIQVGSHGNWHTKARCTLNLLRDATQLRTLTFPHSDVCHTKDNSWYSHYSTTPEGVASYAFQPFWALKKAHEASDSTINVLDIIKIKYDKCEKCKNRKSGSAGEDDDCSNGVKPWPHSTRCLVKCKDSAEHCTDVERKIRKRLASLLGIKDPVTEEEEEATKPTGVESAARFRMVKATEEEEHDSESESEYYSN